MKCLVTGGAGFIGSHLVEKLVERGSEVIVFDDFSAGKLENLSNVTYNVGIVVNSVCNLSKLMEVTSKVDIIFHLATQCLVKGLEDPLLIHQVNDVGTYNVCLVAKMNGCKIVYVGSSEEYGCQTILPIKETASMKPMSLYGVTKLIGEKYVKFFHRVYNVPAVIIRPFNTFGPRQREDGYAGVITSFIKRIDSRYSPIIFGNGLQTRDFSYVDDVIDGILLLSELKDCEVVNLGSGKETTILGLAELVIDLYALYALYGDEWVCNMLKGNLVFDKPRINDLLKLRADIALAKSYGFNPKVSLKEGLKKYVEWWKSTNHRK